MPRNGSGTYTLPEAPFSPNTTISSSVVNDDFSDIATALTGSLARNGEGGMTALLSLSTDGFAYSADPDTGMSRSAANTQIVTCGGEDWTFSTTDLTTPGGVSLLPLIGEIRMWALPTAPTGWVLMRGQACTTAFPLWRAALISAGSPYGTSGGDPRFPNLQTRVPAGVDVDTGGLDGSGTLGAVLGSQSRTLITSNMPPYTPAGAVTITDPMHAHAGSADPSGGQTAGSPSIGTPSYASDASTSPAATGITAAFNGTAQGGTSLPVTVVQPTLIVNFIGRAA